MGSEMCIRDRGKGTHFREGCCFLVVQPAPSHPAYSPPCVSREVKLLLCTLQYETGVAVEASAEVRWFLVDTGTVAVKTCTATMCTPPIGTVKCFSVTSLQEF